MQVCRIVPWKLLGTAITRNTLTIETHQNYWDRTIIKLRNINFGHLDEEQSGW